MPGTLPPRTTLSSFTRAAAPAADVHAVASSSPARDMVLLHGGFSGDSVVGDILRVDPRTLEVTVLQSTPATCEEGPTARFAHCAAAWRGEDGHTVRISSAAFGMSCLSPMWLQHTCNTRRVMQLAGCSLW
jgi:hypothetical protein